MSITPHLFGNSSTNKVRGDGHYIQMNKSRNEDRRNVLPKMSNQPQNPS